MVKKEKIDWDMDNYQSGSDYSRSKEYKEHMQKGLKPKEQNKYSRKLKDYRYRDSTRKDYKPANLRHRKIGPSLKERYAKPTSPTPRVRDRRPVRKSMRKKWLKGRGVRLHEEQLVRENKEFIARKHVEHLEKKEIEEEHQKARERERDEQSRDYLRQSQEREEREREDYKRRQDEYERRRDADKLRRFQDFANRVSGSSYGSGSRYRIKSISYGGEGETTRYGEIKDRLHRLSNAVKRTDGFNSNLNLGFKSNLGRCRLKSINMGKFNTSINMPDMNFLNYDKHRSKKYNRSKKRSYKKKYYKKRRR